eukprot:389719-Amphidinium_carterae.1
MGERQEGMRAQAMATTVSDVNTFTQEKMRGDCYVRLIIKPEANAARKDPVPFSAQTMEPDSSLAAKPGRPFAGVPPPAPVLDSTGELIERDDEFADFEKSSAVLFSFVRHNRYEAVEALVQEDHTIVHKSADEHGNSLLHIACQNKNKRIARLLIKNGLSTNVQNNKGNTPLHYCYQYGFTELAEYLIQNGADDQLPNYDGRQPHQGTEEPKNHVSLLKSRKNCPEGFLIHLTLCIAAKSWRAETLNPVNGDAVCSLVHTSALPLAAKPQIESVQGEASAKHEHLASIGLQIHVASSPLQEVSTHSGHKLRVDAAGHALSQVPL